MTQPIYDQDYTLGETGDTVIYIFPDGDALMDRDQSIATQRIDTLQADKTTLIEPVPLPVDSRLQQLVEMGQLTTAQALVIQHDQEITGLDWQDALQARGWLVVSGDQRLASFSQ